MCQLHSPIITRQRDWYFKIALSFIVRMFSNTIQYHEISNLYSCHCSGIVYAIHVNYLYTWRKFT